MPEKLKSIVESLIFVSEQPVSLDRLCSVLEEHERPEIREALETLVKEYRQSTRGIVLAEVAGGYQFRSKPENADYLRRMINSKTTKFSQSALETLAIIAYRQPITRAEIEYLRGVDSGGVVKTLLEKKLLKILGKKDIPGKPLIYGTSKEFLELFNLKDLSSLPSLKEIQELAPMDAFSAQQDLPLDEPEPVDQ